MENEFVSLEITATVSEENATPGYEGDSRISWLIIKAKNYPAALKTTKESLFKLRSFWASQQLSLKSNTHLHILQYEHIHPVGLDFINFYRFVCKDILVSNLNNDKEIEDEDDNESGSSILIHKLPLLPITDEEVGVLAERLVRQKDLLYFFLTDLRDWDAFRLLMRRHNAALCLVPIEDEEEDTVSSPAQFLFNEIEEGIVNKGIEKMKPEGSPLKKNYLTHKIEELKQRKIPRIFLKSGGELFLEKKYNLLQTKFTEAEQTWQNEKAHLKTKFTEAERTWQNEKAQLETKFTEAERTWQNEKTHLLTLISQQQQQQQKTPNPQKSTLKSILKRECVSKKPKKSLKWDNSVLEAQLDRERQLRIQAAFMSIYGHGNGLHTDVSGDFESEDVLGHGNGLHTDVSGDFESEDVLGHGNGLHTDVSGDFESEDVLDKHLSTTGSISKRNNTNFTPDCLSNLDSAYGDDDEMERTDDSYVGDEDEDVDDDVTIPLSLSPISVDKYAAKIEILGKKENYTTESMAKIEFDKFPRVVVENKGRVIGHRRSASTSVLETSSNGLIDIKKLKGIFEPTGVEVGVVLASGRRKRSEGGVGKDVLEAVKFFEVVKKEEALNNGEEGEPEIKLENSAVIEEEIESDVKLETIIEEPKSEIKSETNTEFIQKDQPKEVDNFKETPITIQQTTTSSNPNNNNDQDKPSLEFASSLEETRDPESISLEDQRAILSPIQKFREVMKNTLRKTRSFDFLRRKEVVAAKKADVSLVAFEGKVRKRMSLRVFERE